MVMGTGMRVVRPALPCPDKPRLVGVSGVGSAGGPVQVLIAVHSTCPRCVCLRTLFSAPPGELQRTLYLAHDRNCPLL